MDCKVPKTPREKVAHGEVKKEEENTNLAETFFLLSLSSRRNEESFFQPRLLNGVPHYPRPVRMCVYRPAIMPGKCSAERGKWDPFKGTEELAASGESERFVAKRHQVRLN